MKNLVFRGGFAVTALLFAAGIMAEPAAMGESAMPARAMQPCQGKMKDMMDADKDGKISKEEFSKHHDEMFSKMDKNSDGALDDSEMEQMRKHKMEHQPKSAQHKHAH